MRGLTTNDRRLLHRPRAAALSAGIGVPLPGSWFLAPDSCVTVIALALLITPAYAQDYPKLKAGLWEMERASERAAELPNRMTICLDDSVQKQMFDMGAGAMKGMCSRHEFKLSGNRGTGDFVCDLGGSRMHSKSTMQLNGNTGYRTEIHTTYDPPFMGRTESTTVLTARHIGACKPGQRAGDMVLPNGQTLNMRDAMSGARAGGAMGGPQGSGTKGGPQGDGAKGRPPGGGHPKSDRQPG